MAKIIITTVLVLINIGLFSQNITTETKKLNKETNYLTIEYLYYNFFNNGKEIKQLNDSINEFFSSYTKEFTSLLDDDIKAEMDSGFISGKYYSDIVMKYYVLKNGYISIFLTISYYTLGAHGNVSFYTYHYDTKNNKFISFADVANLKGQDDLDNFNSIMQKNFKNEDNCFNEQPFVYNPEMRSYYFDDDTITVVFAPYVLGPYACGVAEINIAFKELKK